MDTNEKIFLAMTGDAGRRSSAIRLRAARALSGLTQGQLAAKIGAKNTTVSNAENGAQFPSRALLQFFFHEHRLDFNFMIMGLYAQIPGDVQNAIFPLLEIAQREWDQRESSSRSRASMPGNPQQT